MTISDFPQAMSIADELLDCGTCGEEITVHNEVENLPAREPAEPGMASYTIQTGESLLTLARSFGITLAELLQRNPHINPYFYKAGEELSVPLQRAECPGGQLVTVQSGESLYSIARAHGCSANDLTRANPDTDMSSLLPGQVICLPAFAESAAENRPNSSGGLRFTPYRAQRKSKS